MAAAASAQPKFLLETLPEGSGDQSRGWGIVDAQSIVAGVVGEVRLPGGIWRAAYWEKVGDTWVFTGLPDLTGPGSKANSIDGSPTGENLMAAGFALSPGGVSRAVVWTQDAMGVWSYQTLPQLDTFTEGEAQSILYNNNDPLVIGKVWNKTGLERAAVWKKNLENNWEGTLLPPLAEGKDSAGYDIRVLSNDDLFAVGFALNSKDVQRAVRWRESNDVWQIIPFQNLPDGTGGLASAIELQFPAVLVAGRAETSGGDQHAVLWEYDGSQWLPPTDLGTVGGFDNSHALDLRASESGDDLCSVGFSSDGPKPAVATLWLVEDDTVTVFDLNDLVVGNGSLTLRRATAIDRPQGAVSTEGVLYKTTGWGDEPILGTGPHAFILITACTGDLDGDNDTDHSDLGILLADWGCVGSEPGDCPGDLDGDFDTDHSDLGILLADWGCGT